MKKIYIILSIIGLALTIMPSIFVFNKMISWSSHSSLMLLGTIIWFATAPLWMKKTE